MSENGFETRGILSLNALKAQAYNLRLPIETLLIRH